MIKEYIKTPTSQAYRLLNSGYLVLIASYSKKKTYNIAPIAWHCVVGKSPTRILIAVGREHKTYKNIMESKKFVICVPNFSQLDIVKKTGSVSGQTIDKFSHFNINYTKGNRIKTKLPKGCIGYIECVLLKTYHQPETELIVGECKYAITHKDAFNKRLLCENEKGRGLYHLGGGYFSVPSHKILTF